MSRVAMSYEVITTSLAAGDVERARRRSSRSPPWCTWTRSDGANRSISRAHWRVTLIGQTTSVGPNASAPNCSRSEVSIAIACTVLPSPMSSARIAPIPRSPSSRSQPWPRSWNGNSGWVIAAGVPSGSKCRSSPPSSSAPSASSRTTSPSSSPASSSSMPETARTRSTTDPSRRRSRNRSAFSTSERRSACQRPRTRISGSFAAASSTSSSSVSVVSPIASFQSKRARASVVSSPLERAATLVAVRLTRRRLDEVTQFRGSSTGTPSSSRRGIACGARSGRRRRRARSGWAPRGRTRDRLRRGRARSGRAAGGRRSAGRPSGGSRRPRRRRRGAARSGAPASDRRPPAARARARRTDDVGRRRSAARRPSARRGGG